MPDPQQATTSPPQSAAPSSITFDTPTAPSSVTFDAPGSAPSDTSKAPSWGDWLKAKAAQIGALPFDVQAGALKSVGSTAQGIAKLVGLDQGGPLSQKVSAFLAPSNAAQSVGKDLGNIAQFFLPAGAVGEGAAALSTGSRVLNTLTRAALEGASAGTVASAQQGKVAPVPAAVAAATSGLVTGAQGLVAPLSEKMETALVKPTAADLEDGYDSANVFKYGLGGTLGQTYDAATAKLNTLGHALKGVLQGQPGATVNPYEALFDAADKLQAEAPSNFGNNQAIQGALTKALAEIDGTLRVAKQAGVPVAADGSVDPFIGNQMKQGAGTMGAWYHNPGGGAQADPDASALGKVYTAVYGSLKDDINASVSGNAAPLNAMMSDIIPIRNAIIRRLPVAARANPLSLIDAISLSTGHIPVGLINRALLSGRVANTLAGAAGSQTLAPVAAQVAAGTSSTTAGGSQ